MKTFILQLSLGLSFLFMMRAGATAGPGTWDSTFTPAVTNGAVYAMGLQGDGKLVIGGAFTVGGGLLPSSHVARLLSDGTLDATFSTSANPISAAVWCLAVEPDGRIVIGGDFFAPYPQQTSRGHIARLNANGTLDGSFLPTNTISGSVLAVALQTNNAMIIGGTFEQYNSSSYIARLNADGTTDTSFSCILNGAVYALAIQPDGKIVVGGSFTTANGANRHNIARLNPDGSLDAAFQNGLTGVTGNVRCVQIQGNGKILIGGVFSYVNGAYHAGVARLNTDGSTDIGFTSSPGANNATVYALQIQSDGDILMAGSFAGYDSKSTGPLARLYPDGTIDPSFANSGIVGTLQALAVQSDNRILVGGPFTGIGETNSPNLARVYGDLYPPEFISQPTGHATSVGANVTFSSEVSNPTPVNYQWSKDGIAIPGATGNSYSLFNVQFSDAGNYSVSVTDSLGGTSSSNALLQVGLAPAFTSQASSLVVTQGENVNLAVTATGTPLNYYWKKNGAFISGSTNASLNFGSVVLTNAGIYSCQVSNFVSSITSTGAVLTVLSTNSIVSAIRGAGSNLNLSLIGFPGNSYVLEATTNLTPPVQWLPVVTNAADANGVWQFTDTNLTNAQLYYRVTAP